MTAGVSRERFHQTSRHVNQSPIQLSQDRFCINIPNAIPPCANYFYICPMSKHKTHLLLGGNLGDRHANLAAARQLIGQRIGQVVKASSLYETQPWGKPDQPDFLNQALEVATDLKPEAVLTAVLKIEKELGRQREDKWTARTIDIDLLFFDAKILKTKDLTLPHPHLHERNFALVPMLEIAPNKQHPIFKKTIEELYEASEDDLDVVMLDDESENTQPKPDQR